MDLTEEMVAEIQRQHTEQAGAPPVAEPPKTEPVTSSLTTEEVKTEPAAAAPPVVEAPKVDPTAEPAKVEPVVQKSFEDYLAEKSGGKYKKWEDVETLVNTPKEEFANETVKRLNELAKNGVEINEEIIALQTKDFKSMTNPAQLILEAMKINDEFKGLSNETLRYELGKKYNIEGWGSKEEADYTDEDKANVERFNRDAERSKTTLLKYQEDRVLIKKPDETTLQMQAQARRDSQAKWEGFVDQLSKDVSTFKTVVNDESKESFEYTISESDRKEVGNIMKLLTTDGNVLFNQFMYKGDDGKPVINHQKVYEMLIKSKNYDAAVKTAYNEGKTKGEAKFVKEDLKNIDFKPGDAPSTNPSPATEADALREAMKKSGKTF